MGCGPARALQTETAALALTDPAVRVVLQAAQNVPRQLCFELEHALRRGDEVRLSRGPARGEEANRSEVGAS